MKKNVNYFLIAIVFVLLNIPLAYSAKISELPENSTVTGNNWTVTVDSSYTTTSKTKLGDLLTGALQSKGVYSSGSDISAKITEVGATNCEINLDTSQTLATNLVIPANVYLHRMKGVTLTIPNGITLTINGGISKGEFSTFLCLGTGKVIFGPGSIDWVLPQWWGAKADGTTNDIEALQRCINTAIQSSVPMYAPPGTYIIGLTTGEIAGVMANSWIELHNMTAAGQGLILRGAGRGSTIFKEADGVTESIGNYKKLFFASMNENSYAWGDFLFEGITFDKNAASNATPDDPYDYGQSHIIAFAGDNAPSINSIVLRNIEFKNKTGGGFYAPRSATELEHFVIDDLISISHPSALSTGWGQRGCIEMGIDTTNSIITNTRALYVQIEPTVASSSTRVRRYKLSDVAINALELTDSGGYSFAEVSNAYCSSKLLMRGMHGKVQNSVFAVPDYFYMYSFKVSNSTILFPYDADTKVVSGIYLRNYLTPAYASNFDFSNCDFLINADTVDAAATGYGVTGASYTTSYQPEATFDNCRFDTRLEGTINAYNSGSFTFHGCKMAGHTYGAVGGASSSYNSKLVLDNCDWSAVTGLYLRIVDGSTSNFTVKVLGTYAASEWSQSQANSNSLADTYISRPTLVGAAAPSTGNWFLSDMVINNAPAGSGYIGWVCTASGSPGTWKGFGAIVP